MGLKMTLPQDKNHLSVEFTDAYWAISALGYDFEGVAFTLTCYPSREAKLLAGTNVENASIGGYGLCQPIYRPELYAWSPRFLIADVFPEGIPLGRDAQLTQIYTFIKGYTGLPFEDVFESGDGVEAAHEAPEVEPEPSDPEENAADPEPEPEPVYDPLHL